MDLAASLKQLRSDPTFDPGPLFASLRQSQPILMAGDIAIVTRFRDVQEVLSRDEVFQVPYRVKTEAVTGGRSFLLGMQSSPEYERDLAHMRCAVHRGDDDRVARIVQQTATALVGAAGRTLDVVKQLGRIAPSRLVEEYFGCPVPDGDRLADWAAVMFRFLFADPTNDPAVATSAEGAATEMRAWLDGCIADRKANPSKCDDVLGRCLVLQGAGLPGVDDAGIRANLLGMIVGALPTTSKCCAQALDQLLGRPEQLEKARHAAIAGDDALLAAYVFEALRFRPNHPGLFRIAAADYPLARGTRHGVTIRKGTLVLAATQSAMFDEDIVDEPDEFRVDRPAHVYMHFGYGLHTCFGQYINQVQIPGILEAVLRRPGVRRAPGEAGSLQFDGPYPSSLSVILE
jgi:cytochrome P450